MPVVALLLAILIWGGSYPIIKGNAEGVSSEMFNVFRFGMSTLVAIPYLLARWKSFSFTLFFGALFSSVFLFFAMYLQNIGLKFLDSYVASFFLGSTIIFILLINSILGRTLPKRKDIISACTSLFGLYIMSTVSKKGFEINNGVLCTLGSTFAFSIVMVTTEKLAKRVDLGSYCLLQNIFCFVAFFILSPDSFFIKKEFSKNFLWAAVYCGVFSSGLANFLQVYAQKYVSAKLAALFITLEPLISAIICYFYVGVDILNFKFFISSILILGAIFYSTYNDSKG